jgi:CRISPR/Cas system-associated exonuclease Cas4 (RecB family)
MGKFDPKFKEIAIAMSMFVSNITSAPKPTAVVPNTDWSIARMQVLDTCPRKYYYQYFGGRALAAQNEQSKDEINFLKQFSNEHLIVGDIVHYVIRAYFKNKRKGIDWDLSRLKGFAGRIIKDAANYSTELRDEIYKDYQHIPKSLLEVYFKEQDPIILSHKIRQKADRLLDNFYNTDCFDPLKVGALQPDAMVERKIGFNFPGIHVDGIADLIYPQDDFWVITDWKTGAKEVEETSLQLLVYALWLIKEKGISQDKILIYKAYLNEGILEPLDFSKIQIQRAKARIIQDAERLKELEDFGNEGNIEAFTPCLQEKVCAQCSFKKLCIRN